MGFSLTIAEGQERGREYTFNQPEVSIGRTSDNDVVLQDPGISRKHAKVREEDNHYFVEDLGSANGTKVNGNPLTAEEELQDGDELTVGPVIFAFTAMPNAGENSTRIFNPAELEKKMADTKKVREKSQAAAAARPQSRAATSMSPAIGSAKRPGANGAKSNALVKSSGSKAPVKAPPPGKVAPASDRLKARREAKTPIAKFKLWYSEQPDKIQKGVMAGGAILGLALVGFVGSKALHSNSGGGGFAGPSAEDKTVFELSTGPSQDCYGNDPGATHFTPDKAQFSFNFPVTAKKALATLHFTAGAVQRSEEVEVAVNTVRQGAVERSFGDDMRGQDIPLSTKHLKPNDKNLLVFDNLKNPPGNEPWKICKVWVEVQQLPAGAPNELRDQARQYIATGDRMYEDRKIGASNLFEAWRSYKKARLFLEAMDERVDEYDVVKGNIQKAEKELNESCAKIMLQGAAMEKTGKEGDAIKIYKGGLAFFPERDHPCFQQLHDALNRLE